MDPCAAAIQRCAGGPAPRAKRGAGPEVYYLYFNGRLLGTEMGPISDIPECILIGQIYSKLAYS